MFQKHALFSTVFVLALSTCFTSQAMYFNSWSEDDALERCAQTNSLPQADKLGGNIAAHLCSMLLSPTTFNQLSEEEKEAHVKNVLAFVSSNTFNEDAKKEMIRSLLRQPRNQQLSTMEKLHNDLNWFFRHKGFENLSAQQQDAASLETLIMALKARYPYKGFKYRNLEKIATPINKHFQALINTEKGVAVIATLQMWFLLVFFTIYKSGLESFFTEEFLKGSPILSFFFCFPIFAMFSIGTTPKRIFIINQFYCILVGIYLNNLTFAKPKAT